MRMLRGVILSLVVVVGGLSAVTAQAAPPPPPRPHAGAPVPQNYPEVPVAALPDIETPEAGSPTAPALPEVPVGDYDVDVQTRTAGDDFTPVGDSGLEIAGKPRSTNGVAPSSDPTPEPVSVQVLTSDESAALGVSGLAIKVTSDDPTAVALRVPDGIIDSAFGANYASRVQWVSVATDGTKQPLTATAAQVAAGGETLAATEVSTVAAPQGVVLAALSQPTSADGSGTFSSTPLAASGAWQVSGNSGSFTWSYPLTAPPVSAGPAPALSLSYDSGSVDGRTGLTNNQAGVLGEGWDLAGGGFIERSYAACSQDGQAGSGDLCWSNDNATVSFGGHSGVLVKDTGTGVWRMMTGDGTKVEKLTGATNGDNDGEYWKLTTTDGTQYFFGQNRFPGWVTGNTETASAFTVPVFGNNTGEPCKGASFAVSSCAQAWRWNLDRVLDVDGNVETFYYQAQLNAYLRSGTTKTNYTMGGTLSRVDYGLRAGGEYGTAPAQVVFENSDRCASPTNCVLTNPANYPDTPLDLYCLSSTCTQVSPTFWITQKLGAVRTQIWSGSAYTQVDRWALTQTYPAPGDGTTPSLWLSKVTRTAGTGGAAITLPDVKFTGTTMANRVWAFDGLAPLVRYRVNAVTTETGAAIAVVYSGQECTPTALPAAPESNTMRCFPQRWVPPAPAAQVERLDYFHKYVVTSIGVNPGPNSGSPAENTAYDYLGGPAWRYVTDPVVPAAKRTWSVYLGYRQVRERHGDLNTPSQQETTLTTYFQGMDGDRLNTAGGSKTVTVPASDSTTVPDALWLSGSARETITYNGNGGARVANTITAPWVSPAIGTDGVNTVKRVGDGTSTTRTALAAGGDLTTSVITTVDALGRPTAVDDRGDTGVAADDVCTRTTYADNTTTNLIAFPARVTVTGLACTGTPVLPSDAVSDTKTFYDTSSTLGAAPTRGNPTRVDVAASYTGSTPNDQTMITRMYDALGRVTAETDPRITPTRTTTTAYTPATGLLTKTVQTNPLGWTTTTTMEPTRGSVTKLTDINGNVTEATYDALGRRSAVWNPDHVRATFPTEPSATYGYSITATAPPWVSTRQLTVGGFLTSYAIYDGLFRVRQTQTPQYSTDVRVITDTLYNAAGRVASTRDQYSATGAPDGTIVIPTLTVPSGTVTQYDGAGRVTAAIKLGNETEMWRTTFGYGGNSVSVTPPAGGTATTTTTDGRGRTVQIKQYQAATPTGAADVTGYSYDRRDSLTGMTDATGNTWSWTFDVLGRATGSRDPDAGVTSRTYDAAGRVATTTDGRGTVLAFTYDQLDRKTASFNTSTTGTKLTSWTYDTLTAGKGKLTSSTRYAGTDQYIRAVTGYDPAGRPTGQSTTIPTSAGVLAGTYSSTMTYTVDGQVQSTTSPAGGGLPAENLWFSYDSMARPNGLWNDSDYYLSGTAYTELGELAQINQFSGSAEVYRSFSRDVRTQRVQADETLYYNAGYKKLESHAYTYTNAGLLTADKNTPTGVAVDLQCYRYDYKQQLTDAWTPNAADCTAAPGVAGYAGPAPNRINWTIDPAGNRTSETLYSTTGGTNQVRTYTYPTPGAAAVRPHATTGTTTTGTTPGTVGYGYDNAGNTTTQTGTGAKTLTYNTEGRLATSTVGAAVDNRIYDADGTLLMITGSTGKQLFLGDTILTVTGTSTVVSGNRTYTFAGFTIAERTATTAVTGSVLRFCVSNTQGTITSTLDMTGTPTRRYLTPYGGQRGPATPTIGTIRNFLNQPTNPTTALTHLGARDYDPTNGRFTTVDPILAPYNPAQNNGYNYGANNPITNTDPDGKCYQNSRTGNYEGVNCGGGVAAATPGTHMNNTKITWWALVSPATRTSGPKYKEYSEDRYYNYTPYVTQPANRNSDTPAKKTLRFIAEVSGANAVRSCIKNPSISGCTSAAVQATPGGRFLKAAKIGLELLDATRLATSASSSRGAGDYYAKKVLEGGRPDRERVLAGHGVYRAGSGTTTVPSGTTLVFYSRDGDSITDSVGLEIERGGGPSPVRIFEAGSEVPNYTLKAPDGLTVMSESTTVDSSTL